MNLCLNRHTVCPRSSDPLYTVSYYIILTDKSEDPVYLSMDPDLNVMSLNLKKKLLSENVRICWFYTKKLLSNH